MAEGLGFLIGLIGGGIVGLVLGLVYAAFTIKRKIATAQAEAASWALGQLKTHGMTAAREMIRKMGTKNGTEQTLG